jgi:hypothetical protein
VKDPAYFAYDVYRLSVSVAGDGWQAGLQNALAAVKFGATHPVPVFLKRTSNAAPTAVVTLTATSESDPTKTATSTFTLSR